jgi:hypothetical protein
VPTNIRLGDKNMLYVEEDPETVLQAMSEGGYAKLTYLHQMHKTPVGPGWVNTAQVRFLNELG